MIDLQSFVASGLDYASGEEIRGRLEPRQELRGVVFEDCDFTDCVLDEAVLRNCDFTDCRFRSSSLSLTKLPGTSFSDTTLSECRAMSVAWSQVIPKPVSLAPLTFERCKLTYSSFVGAKLRRWAFIGCNLTDSEFGDAVVTGAVFKDCDLTGARFNGADLRDVNLRTSFGYAFDPRDALVKGLRVNAVDGAQLLRAFRIDVSD